MLPDHYSPYLSSVWLRNTIRLVLSLLKHIEHFDCRSRRVPFPFNLNHNTQQSMLVRKLKAHYKERSSKLITIRITTEWKMQKINKGYVLKIAINK